MYANLIARYARYGNPLDIVELEETTTVPAPGELLVRMIASPVNPSDLIPMRGAYAHRTRLPAIPGFEGVGTVVDAGRGVPEGWIGKRVLPLRGEGTWQRFVRVPARHAVPVPGFVSDHTAAQLYINPLTARLVCTDVLGLGPGRTVAANACGSVFGRLLAQLSRIYGFRLIAVVRGGRRADELLALGADAVVDESTASPAHAAAALTNGRGVDAVVDTVGGESGTSLAFALRPGGAYLSAGLLSGEPADWTAIRSRVRAEVKLFHLRHWLRDAADTEWQQSFETWFGWLQAGTVALPAPAACYPLHELRSALRHAESAGSRTGKVMLTF